MGNKAGGKSEDQVAGGAEWFNESEGREGKIELEINTDLVCGCYLLRVFATA